MTDQKTDQKTGQTAGWPALPVRNGEPAVPDGWRQEWERAELRDGVPVLVRRYADPDGTPGERLMTVTRRRDGLLYSISDRRAFRGALPAPDDARALAAAAWAELSPGLGDEQTFLRAQAQERAIADPAGTRIPVLWLKFAHASTGTFGWVTVGPGGAIVEIEHLVSWDYRASRRRTEMWDDDAWLAAREGRGPQLPSPAALA